MELNEKEMAELEKRVVEKVVAEMTNRFYLIPKMGKADCGCAAAAKTATVPVSQQARGFTAYSDIPMQSAATGPQPAIRESWKEDDQIYEEPEVDLPLPVPLDIITTITPEAVIDYIEAILLSNKSLKAIEDYIKIIADSLKDIAEFVGYGMALPTFNPVQRYGAEKVLRATHFEIGNPIPET